MKTRTLGGVVLSLPVVMKIIPLLPVSFLIFVQIIAWIYRRATRSPSGSLPSSALSLPPSALSAGRQAAASSFGFALGLFLFFLVVPSMMVGWKANWQNLKTWSNFMLTKADDGGEDPRSGNSHSMRNQSLHNAVYRFGNFVWHEAGGGADDESAENFVHPPLLMDSSFAEAALLVARLAVLGALGFAGIRLGKLGDPLSVAVAFALGCAAMLVVSPVARGHYFMLVAPAVLFFPLWLDRRRLCRAAAVFAIVPLLLIDAHYIFFILTGRVGLLGLGTTAWLLSALIYVDRNCRASAEAALPKSDSLDSLPLSVKQAA
jgi:hypothetical protein